MKAGFALAAAAAAALSAVPPAPAAAYMSGPINIKTCTVAGTGGYVGTGAVHIVWSNTKPVAATNIWFHVAYGGVSLELKEKGTFSQFAVIDKHYNGFNGIGYAGPKPQICVVKQVTYADGTTIAP